MPGADVRVLGPVEVIGDDGELRLAAKQVRLLCALVIADGRECGVDELVDSVWGASPPASVRKVVQVYVSQLRKVLPAGIEIVTAPGAYALRVPPQALDAARFERLLGESRAAARDGNPALAASLADQALGLWRGRAYGDLAYEDLAREESERLEELRLVAVEERLAAGLALGRHAELVGEALALAADRPYRERVHELAMLALYRCGRQAEALDHYATLRARLDDELGLEPGQALRELQRRILQQDAALDLVVELVAADALPAPPNPLVGRARELAELRSLLELRESRLIVLTGAGGSGKTRLALEAAREAAGAFANGAAVVELAPLRDPELVVPTIARSLEVAVDPGAEALAPLTAALAPQELLLVVDNAEHVRSAAPALAELVARAPRLMLLVTSRAVLHVSGERVFPVAPLPEDDAVELFVQRAQLLEPDFERTAGNDADVREICAGVDCLPLAVELAAARIRTLTPRALRERLDARLRVLTGGPRDLPARQQTLRETIDWSVSLLDEGAQAVFARLAVFPSGATVEAAETVCGASLDALATLVDDHLARREDSDAEPRYGMLETVREYALELLGDERTAVELVLAEYYASVVERFGLSDPREVRWDPALQLIDRELDNIGRAVATAATSGAPALPLGLAGELWRYWWVRGSAREGLQWIERALAASEGSRTSARARALRGGAGLAWSIGDVERAESLARDAVLVAVESGAKWDEGASHTVLGVVANTAGDHTRAREHHERALEISLELGVEPVVEKLNIGVVALDQGDYETALGLLEEVLASHRRHDRPGGMGFALANIGLARYELGDHEGSRLAFEEARAGFEQVGMPQQVAYTLQGLAAAEAHESRFEEAARLLGEARRELEEFGSPEESFSPRMIGETKRRVREALGDEAFEAAYEAGLERASTT